MDWLQAELSGVQTVSVVEDHSSRGGLGEFLLGRLAEHDALGRRRFRIFGVDGIPHWGTPKEALAAHRLDGESLATRILDFQRAPTPV